MRKKIAVISGSTRSLSSNLNLICAIKKLTEQSLEFDDFKGLELLPAFNPDLNGDDIESVSNFRHQLIAADGILICTPEYAHGVPGALKNAIDWTVGSGEFSDKPTVLITASTDGKYGHAALLETLHVLEAKYVGELNLLIPFAQAKITSAGEIVDGATKTDVLHLMHQFIHYLQ